jgi:hypothetical protein
MTVLGVLWYMVFFENRKDLPFDVQILSHTTEDPMAILMQCIKNNTVTAHTQSKIITVR